MVATWGWRVATISGVQLPWNVDQAVSETHELRQVSAGQCAGQRRARREGTRRHRQQHQHPEPALLHRHLQGPQESTSNWQSPVHWHSSKVKTGWGKIWGQNLSDDKVQKSKWAGEKFGEGMSLWWHISKVQVSSATGIYWVPEGKWQPCCTSHGTVHPGQLPALAVRPSNPHTELLRKGKLWDFMEGTAGLWCHERAKLSMMKPPRHVLVHQMSSLN